MSTDLVEVPDAGPHLVEVLPPEVGRVQRGVRSNLQVIILIES